MQRARWVAQPLAALGFLFALTLMADGREFVYSQF